MKLPILSSSTALQIGVGANLHLEDEAARDVVKRVISAARNDGWAVDSWDVDVVAARESVSTVVIRASWPPHGQPEPNNPLVLTALVDRAEFEDDRGQVGLTNELNEALVRYGMVRGVVIQPGQAKITTVQPVPYLRSRDEGKVQLRAEWYPGYLRELKGPNA